MRGFSPGQRSAGLPSWVILHGRMRGHPMSRSRLVAACLVAAVLHRRRSRASPTTRPRFAQSSDAFVAAFDKGDAKAVAELWTADGAARRRSGRSLQRPAGDRSGLREVLPGTSGREDQSHDRLDPDAERRRRDRRRPRVARTACRPVRRARRSTPRCTSNRTASG